MQSYLSHFLFYFFRKVRNVSSLGPGSFVNCKDQGENMDPNHMVHSLRVLLYRGPSGPGQRLEDLPSTRPLPWVRPSLRVTTLSWSGRKLEPVTSYLLHGPELPVSSCPILYERYENRYGQQCQVVNHCGGGQGCDVLPLRTSFPS